MLCPQPINEDMVFNPGILIQENLFEVITCVAPDEKLAISHASLFLEDFDPPLYELSFFKEVPRSKTLLSFSFKHKEKVFKPGILTSEEVHSSLIPELSHQGCLDIVILILNQVADQLYSSLQRIHTAKTLDLVWIWLGGDLGNDFYWVLIGSSG
nr:hypothetical protein [Tanacetum cinerariifolium]